MNRDIIQRKPIGADGWNWGKMPFRLDPMTQRTICRDCWDGEHRGEKTPCCPIPDCKCMCIDREAAKRDAAKKKAAKSREYRKEHQNDDPGPLAARNEANFGVR